MPDDSRTLGVQFTGDPASLFKSLDDIKKEVKELRDEVKHSNTEMDKGAKSAKDMSGGLQGLLGHVGGLKGAVVGLGVAMGITFSAKTMVNFAQDSVAAAADMVDSLEYVETAFGMAADGADSAATKMVKAFADDAPQALYISERSALSAAGEFGLMFKTMGLSEKASADMSIAILRLAADLAEVHKQDISEVLDKIHSGMNGRVNGLREYAAGIDETTVAAYAYKAGLVGVDEELSRADRAQAVFLQLLDETKYAQGEAAKSADELGNQVDLMRAQWDELKVEVGTRLLPIFISLVSFLTTHLPGAIDTTIVGIDRLGAWINTVSNLMSLNWGQAMIDMAFVTTGSTDNIVSTIQQNAGLSVGILAAATSVMSANNAGAWGNIANVTSGAISFISRITGEGFADIVNEAGRAHEGLANVIVRKAWINIAETILDATSEIRAKTAVGFVELVQKIGNILAEALRITSKAFEGIYNTIKGFFEDLPEPLKVLLGVVFDWGKTFATMKVYEYITDIERGILGLSSAARAGTTDIKGFQSAVGEFTAEQYQPSNFYDPGRFTPEDVFTPRRPEPGEDGGAGDKPKKPKTPRAGREASDREPTGAAELRIADVAKAVAEALREGIQAIRDLRGADIEKIDELREPLQRVEDFFTDLIIRMQRLGDVMGGANLEEFATKVGITRDAISTVASAVSLASEINNLEVADSSKLKMVEAFMIETRDVAVRVATLSVEQELAIKSLNESMGGFVGLIGQILELKPDEAVALTATHFGIIAHNVSGLDSLMRQISYGWQVMTSGQREDLNAAMADWVAASTDSLALAREGLSFTDKIDEAVKLQPAHLSIIARNVGVSLSLISQLSQHYQDMKKQTREEMLVAQQDYVAAAGQSLQLVQTALLIGLKTSEAVKLGPRELSVIYRNITVSVGVLNDISLWWQQMARVEREKKLAAITDYTNAAGQSLSLISAALGITREEIGKTELTEDNIRHYANLAASILQAVLDAGDKWIKIGEEKANTQLGGLAPYASAAEASVSLLNTILALTREEVGALRPTDTEQKEYAALATSILQNVLDAGKKWIEIGEEKATATLGGVEPYVSAASASIGLINDILALTREEVGKLRLTEEQQREFANLATSILIQVLEAGDTWIKLGENEAKLALDGVKPYTEAATNAVNLLADVVSLSQEGVGDLGAIRSIAHDGATLARDILQATILAGELWISLGENEAKLALAGVKPYTDAAKEAVGLLADVLGITRDKKEIIQLTAVELSNVSYAVRDILERVWQEARLWDRRHGIDNLDGIQDFSESARAALELYQSTLVDIGEQKKIVQFTAIELSNISYAVRDILERMWQEKQLFDRIHGIDSLKGLTEFAEGVQASVGIYSELQSAMAELQGKTIQRVDTDALAMFGNNIQAILTELGNVYFRLSPTDLVENARKLAEVAPSALDVVGKGFEVLEAAMESPFYRRSRIQTPGGPSGGQLERFALRIKDAITSTINVITSAIKDVEMPDVDLSKFDPLVKFYEGFLGIVERISEIKRISVETVRQFIEAVGILTSGIPQGIIGGEDRGAGSDQAKGGGVRVSTVILNAQAITMNNPSFKFGDMRLAATINNTVNVSVSIRDVVIDRLAEIIDQKLQSVPVAMGQ